MLHLMLGDMKFSAIKLRPIESVPPESRTLQLHLWGLTLGICSPKNQLTNDELGVLTDFLGMAYPDGT